MAWTIRNSNAGLIPGGSANNYYWNVNNNPNATYNNCLANCTTLAYGRVLENGQQPPVSRIVDAGNWHNYVTNGWVPKPYNSYHSSIKAGDIIEWPGHVAVVEQVINGVAWCSSSLYTGDHGRAQWPVGSGIWDTRTPSIMGNTFLEMWNWFYNNNYGWRVYEYVSENTITSTRIGASPTYILVNPNSIEPPTPSTENLEISINPSSYSVTMSSNEDYVDFTFAIAISGIPAGQTVSGGNTYPDLTRVYNSGWSYTDYVIDGTTYRRANKTQTLRYYRVGTGAYSTVKHMYYNLTMSTGSISSDTPMYINVEAKTPLIAIISKLARRRNRAYVEIK